MLIGMEIVKELVETIILTGRIEGASPVSLILIAAPEQGKTSVALSKDFPSASVITDVSGIGLQKLCQTKPEYSHFIINDLIAPSAKKQSVKMFFISMLCAMTEEGIRSVHYPGGGETFQNGKRAIIGCIPSGLVDDKRAWWQRSGFMSRMFPFNYRHSQELRVTIKNSIDNGKSRNTWSEEVEVFKVPEKPIPVAFRPEASRLVRKIADMKSQEMREVGYRRLHQFRTIAQAHAMRRSFKRPSVNMEDVAFLERIFPYVSFKTSKDV